MTDPNDDFVTLHHISASLSSSKGREFTVDAVRAAEGLLTDQELQEKYELSAADWEAITKNSTLIRNIQSERARRVRSGQAAREAAAQHFVKAPAILDQIMSNEQSSPRHKIEAIKELRATAAGAAGAEATIDAGEKFIIQINLGGGTEIIEKVITPVKPLLDAVKIDERQEPHKGNDNE
jgi:hypothetical protein